MPVGDGHVLVARVDAGPRIGSGHLVRSLALAQAWQDLGGRAVIATASPPQSLPSSVTGAGVEIVALDEAHPGPGDPRVVESLAARIGATWIACDGYHFDAGYTSALRRAGLRVLVIDDIADAAAYAADVILNHNLDAGRYRYRAAAGTRLLLGTRYCLLRREFRRQCRREPPPAVRTVLVTMGGADPGNQTLVAMQALAACGDAGLAVCVLVGRANRHRAQLESLAAGYPWMQLVTDPADVPAVFAGADLAVSAGGSTCWELAYFGIPAVLITLSANQAGITAALAEAGAALHLGPAAAVGAADIGRAVQALVADESRRRAMAARARGLVDGCGALRVARVLRDDEAVDV